LCCDAGEQRSVHVLLGAFSLWRHDWGNANIVHAPLLWQFMLFTSAINNCVR
jgi:hypothetical protein